MFPTHIGAVAGKLMDQIENVDEDAPLINALITRSNGIPGRGFGGYYDRLWRPSGGRYWENATRKQKLEIVEEIRAEVRQYRRWDQVYRDLYGVDPKEVILARKYTEKDGKPPETARRPGAGESPEHRNLKLWAAANPEALGLSETMVGTPEQGLLSGDRVDVLFTDGAKFVAVEVKSILSSEDDWQRGIYQCVKYRAVVSALEKPLPVSVRTILLTELPLTPELKTRARELGVQLKVKNLNGAK
ncbi:hypothetical protein [Euryhalocaulis sp.]|uniref:hypothetical protein n=1 Tax=Euryhalocaulis sp. TaxID=2744307 RepID=UPI00257FC47E|nr:hypothetical protein [Euryhalocaulis sp.]